MLDQKTLLSQPSGALDPSYNKLDQLTRSDLANAPLPASLLNRASAAPNRITVTTVNDEIDPNDNLISLREAIQLANSTPSDDEIFLSSGVYILSIGGANENNNQTGDLDILNNGSLRIYSFSPGATINAAGLDRIFDVMYGASLTLENLTITGGAVYEGEGGGILNNGTVTLNGSSIVSGNRAEAGGGIYNYGIVILNDSSTISGNRAETGGGIYNWRSVTLNNSSTVSSNSAEVSGGGVYNKVGTVALNGSSTISSNTATYGGGIANAQTDRGTVILKDASAVSGNRADHGGGIYNPLGIVTLNDSSTISNNTATYGGGISNARGHVILHDVSAISSNRADYGGGIYNDGTVDLNDTSIVSGNRAEQHGGGIYNKLSNGLINGATSARVYGNYFDDTTTLDDIYQEI